MVSAADYQVQKSRYQKLVDDDRNGLHWIRFSELMDDGPVSPKYLQMICLRNPFFGACSIQM